VIFVFPFALAAVFLAILVHVTSILAMPALTTNDLHSRLAAIAPVNEFVPLTAERVRALRLPFHDTAFEAAACRYDLGAGVLRIRAVVPETLLLMAMVQKGGGVFFTVSDRAAVKGTVDILLGTPEQIRRIESADTDEETTSEFRVRAPKAEGVVMVRIFVPAESMRAKAAATMAQATCQTELL
jgi:uncharacterized membrane protein